MHVVKWMGRSVTGGALRKAAAATINSITTLMMIGKAVTQLVLTNKLLRYIACNYDSACPTIHQL